MERNYVTVALCIASRIRIVSYRTSVGGRVGVQLRRLVPVGLVVWLQCGVQYGRRLSRGLGWGAGSTGRRHQTAEGTADRLVDGREQRPDRLGERRARRHVRHPHGLMHNGHRYCIHLYSHKLQLQNNKLKKNKGKRDTQRVKKHNLSNACYIYTTEAQGNINIGNRRHGNAQRIK